MIIREAFLNKKINSKRKLLHQKYFQLLRGCDFIKMFMPWEQWSNATEDNSEVCGWNKTWSKVEMQDQ